MMTRDVSERKTLIITGLLVLLAFIVLGVAEYRIEHTTDPDRLRLSFTKPDTRSLDAELCSDGPARDLSVTATVGAEREPYFEKNITVRSRGCVTLSIPDPEMLPDDRPTQIRIRAEDADGRAPEIFRMLP